MDRPVTNPRKVLKSPVIRRKSKPTPLSERVHLEKVLGLTATNNAALDVDPHTGTIAYPAGCVVVLYNPKRNRQQHIFNHSHKTITCLAFSADGKHLITGECGHQPAVRVWELEERTQVGEFHGHKFGIACVAFHPNQKYVVSIGTQHDMGVNLWNWRSNTKLASNKVASKVTDLSFSEDGSVFVTTGNRHVKFWYLDANKSRVKETVPLLGRSGILGEQRNNFFCGSAFGRGEQASSMFCITKSGLLCEFNEKRLLDKWVELRTTSANCITVGQRDIFIGCADGIIRVFNAKTLNFVATLPRPHYLGVDVAAGMEPSHMIAPHNDATYPDTIAVRLDLSNQKITCVYNDHSLYIWDVHEVRKVGKTRSFLFHSSCIWGLDMYPSLGEKSRAVLPPGSFFTCSSDNTIRVWNLDPHMSSEMTLKRNIYSHELLKIIYADPELNNIKDVDFNPAGKTDKTDTQCMEKNGVRSIQVSPDGRHLASGDRVGNIRVHDLQFMEEHCMLEAHNSEVLCLEYTKSDIDMSLLASASRDRLIHVFDPHQNYDIVQTLDDHSSAITAVRFTEQEGQLHMLSCGADKSLLFRTLQKEEDDADFQFVLNRHLVGKTTLYDMDVDPTEKYVATACQDRNVRIYNIMNGKQKKCYKGSTGDDGTLIKVQLDPSGAYIATSCSDKNLSINDFFSGECLATMFGHSELVTGVKFMNDLKHLISVSGDGCIFVWRLPLDFTEHMQQRFLSLGKIPQGGLITTPDTRRATYMTNNSKMAPSITVGNTKSDYPVIDTNFQPATKVIEDLAEGEPDSNGTHLSVGHRDGYRFSVGQLPSWAKKQVMSDPVPKVSNTMSGQTAPKGRWAQRIDNQGIVMKSQLDENNHIELSLSDSEKRRFTVEPETLNEQLKEMRRETVVLSRSEHNKLVPVITDDDENNRDDEDEDDEFCQDPEKMKNMFEENALGLKGSGKVTFSRGSDPTSRTPGRTLEPRPHRFSDFTGLWRKRGSLTNAEDVDGGEDDEEEENQDEMIYYLPNEDTSESSETIASSFRVIEGDTASYKDVGEMESEGTDPLSMSDESAPPTPTTPRDVSRDFSDATEEEEFLRKNFENLGASPAMQGETFGESLDQLEKQLNNTSNYFSHRLSISSRFLSRAQQQHLKNIALQTMQQQQQGPQQRSRSQSPSVPPPQAVTRRMGRDEDGSRTPNPWRPATWQSGEALENPLPERDAPHSAIPIASSTITSAAEVPKSDLPSPPTKLSTQEEPQESNRRSRSSLTGSQTPTRGRRSEPGERGTWNKAFSSSDNVQPPAWQRGLLSNYSKGRRSIDASSGEAGSPLSKQSSRKWKSMLDISEKEESPRSPSPLSSGSRTLPRRSKTPNPHSSRSITSHVSPTRYVSETEVRLESPARARSRQGRTDPDRRSSTPSFSSNKTAPSSDQTTPTKSKKPLTRVHSYQKPTTSSTSKTSKTSISGSTNALNKDPEGTNKGAPKKGPGARRSRFNNGMKEKFQSTPDLAGDADADNEFGMMTAEDVYVAHRNQDNMIPRHNMPATRDIRDPYSHQSMSSGQTDAMAMPKEGSPDEDIPPLPASEPPGSNVDSDRMAMPPPLSGTLPRAKGKTKKSVMSDLTLSQAKAILLGKPMMSRSESTDSDQGMPADAPTTDGSMYEEPIEKTPRPKLPPPPVDTLRNLPTTGTISSYRDVPTSTVAAMSYHDLDVSPNEPPVKDEPSSMRSPRHNRERSPGARKSPFVGQKCEVFENLQVSPGRTRAGSSDRSWEEERQESKESSPIREGDPHSINNRTFVHEVRDDNARPGSPLKSPLKNMSQSRSFSLGDIKQFTNSELSIPSPSENLGEHRSSSEEQLFEPNVQKRVAQFELASPRTQRRMLATGGSWRQRLVQVGEGDEGGLEGEPLPSWLSHQPPKSPQTPLSPPLTTTPPSLPPREASYHPTSPAGVSAKTLSPPQNAGPTVSSTAATHHTHPTHSMPASSRPNDLSKPLVSVAVTEFVSNPRSSLTFTFNRPPVATTSYTGSTTATTSVTQKPLISSRASDSQTKLSASGTGVSTATSMQHSNRPGGLTASSSLSSSQHSRQQLTSQGTVSTSTSSLSSSSQSMALNVPSNRANASLSETLPLSPQTSPDRPSRTLNQTYVKSPMGLEPTSPPQPCVSVPQSVVAVSGADRTTVSVDNSAGTCGSMTVSHGDARGASAQSKGVVPQTASSRTAPASAGHHQQASQLGSKSSMTTGHRERSRSGEDRVRQRSGEDPATRRKDSLAKQVTWKDIAEVPSGVLSPHKTGSVPSGVGKQESSGAASGGELSASPSSAAAGPSEGSPEEILRPDKSRMSPPLSLTTTPPQEINHSRVVLTQPSPAEAVSPKPDRSRLSLPVTPSGDNTFDESACARAVCDLQTAVDRAVLLLQKEQDGANKAMLMQAMLGARKEIDTVLPTDKKTEEILHTYSHQLSDRIYTLLQSKLDPR